MAARNDNKSHETITNDKMVKSDKASALTNNHRCAKCSAEMNDDTK